jgi:amino acid adenylation domain-containing protein
MENHFDIANLKRLSLEDKRELLRRLLEKEVKNSNQHVLSFGQQRLWFLNTLNPDNSVYNIPLTIKIKGDLNDESFKKSIHDIIRRHESLRTNFIAVEGKPLQLISEDIKPDCSIVDLTHLPSSVRKETALQHAFKDTETPFKLDTDSLLRVRVYKIDRAEHIVLIVMHHIISDGWSFGIFCRELSLCYRSYENKQPVTFEPLPMQYAAYAKLQRKQLTGEGMENLVSFWKKYLQGAPQLFQIPTDRDRPSVQTFQGKKYYFEINSAVIEKLKSIGHQSGASLYMTVLAAFAILLHKHSGQNDVVVGTANAGRNDKRFESLIGFFSNLLPIRSTIDPGDTFRQMLVKTRDILFDAFEHQDLPFDKLVEELAPERNLSYNPIVQVGFSFLNDQLINSSILGFETERIELNRDIVRFDLDFTLRENDFGLKGFCLYNVNLYNESTIANLVQHFHALIEKIVLNPDHVIKKLSILPSHERVQLREWSCTYKEYPKEKTVYELFQDQVDKTPNNIALVYEEQELTYEELNEKSNLLAKHIREQYHKRTKQELKQNTLIALYLDRSLEMVVGILAVLKAGAAYVPLDTSYPQERIDYLLTDTHTALVLSQRHLTCADIQLPKEKIVYVDLTEELYHREKIANLPQHATATDLAYVMYTSGTTGKPKGVMVEHRSIINLLQNQIVFFDIKKEDVALQFASYIFDASVSEIFTAITVGAQLSIVSNKLRYDAHLLSEFIEFHRVNIATIPPAMLSVMPYSQGKFINLRTLVVAGESCSKELMEQWSQGRNLINAYGPTESTVCATMHKYELGDISTNIGKPLDNTTLYVLDGDLTPVPIGVVGELYIGGACLARGYLNSDLTEQRFISNLFANEADTTQGYNRLYKTGDLVRWLVDGNMEYIGRNDDQVKIRGYRIELREIEYALSQIHGIKQSCVLVKERKTEAGSIRYLVGYYVLKENNESLTQSAVLDGLIKSLPDYMIPNVLLAMKSFPLTINGKIDRYALPDPTISSIATDSSMPATEIEATVCKIWQEVLGLEKVVSSDDFFKLGGSSILAIQISHQMSEALDADVSVADIFDLKTIDAVLKKIVISKTAERVEWRIPN